MPTPPTRSSSLLRELGADAVFANADYEPYAHERDQRVKQALLQQRRELLLFKDHVIFEKDEILSGSGRPFSVFTPYKNAWLKRVRSVGLWNRTTPNRTRTGWSSRQGHGNSNPETDGLRTHQSR